MSGVSILGIFCVSLLLGVGKIIGGVLLLTLGRRAVEKREDEG